MATDSRAPEVSAVTWTMMILSSLAICLRVFCRTFLVKSFGWDDWLAVLAQIFFILFSAFELRSIRYGTGRHTVDIPEQDVSRAMKMWWTCELLYVLTNMALKASIAIFLLRICVRRLHKSIIWFVTGVTEVYSLFFLVLFLVQCRPAALFWRRFTDNPPQGSCLSMSVIAGCFYGYSAVGCLTDWTYSLLPIILVSNLQMHKSTKLSVMALLAAGVIASSATIVRFPYIHTLHDEDDYLYATSDIAIWSTVETGIGITTAAFATLRPLLRVIFQGSSAPGYGPSVSPHWGGKGRRSTGLTNGGGYVRENSTTKGDEAFELAHKNARIGITTVINHGSDAGLANDMDSDASGSITQDGWNGSQAHLAGDVSQEQQQQPSAWNIKVKKTIVQTTGSGHDAA